MKRLGFTVLTCSAAGILIAILLNDSKQQPVRSAVEPASLAQISPAPRRSTPGSEVAAVQQPAFQPEKPRTITPENPKPGNPVSARAKLPVPVPAKPKKPELQDPLAREALGLVGADAMAEMYWYSAINDPTLSAHERQDLIEDLNEDGLSDPHHPTIDDLPLILSRINLIENVGPDAMDPVNAAAFQEAYKDLVNLARVAAGQAPAE